MSNPSEKKENPGVYEKMTRLIEDADAPVISEALLVYLTIRAWSETRRRVSEDDVQNMYLSIQKRVNRTEVRDVVAYTLSLCPLVAQDVQQQAAEDSLRQFAEQEAEEIVAEGASPEDQAMKSELIEQLLDQLNRLSRTHRVTLILHYQGMETEEIARRLGAQEGAIRTRLSRAHATLRDSIKPPDGR